MLRHSLIAAATVAALVTAAPVAAQQAAAGGALRVAPSGRATTAVSLTPPRVQGQPAAAPKVIKIDYGQPHARGRQVLGTLIIQDSVWRLGANEATSLTSDVDLDIGGVAVPAGSYTLFLVHGGDGAKLVVSRKTGQWGTAYEEAQDLARIPMESRTLTEPVESLAITLVPSTQAPAQSVLDIRWGTAAYSVPWKVKS